MLYLNNKKSNILRAKKEFHNGMIDFVYKRIDKFYSNSNVNNIIIENLFNDLILENIDDILVGEPELLNFLNEHINPFIYFSPDFRAGIEYVFNYDLFIYKSVRRYDAYNLAQSLNISTCPYCNRNYTNTVIKSDGKKLTRPQFDHYFDRSSNPLLAISFYNLIPSCSICNSSIKGTHKMNLTKYLHPYLDNNIGDIRFTYKFTTKTASGLQVKVITPMTSKSQNTVNAFAIEEVYNSHTGELLDLLKTRQYFSDKYLSILSSNLLKHVIVSKEDLYRIVFGTEFDSLNFINRPFSKFKNDILKELGVI